MRANTDKIEDHKKELENFNTFQTMTSKNLERTEQKIQKNREFANEQLTKCKNDIDERINELDKTQSENVDDTNRKFAEIKQIQTTNLNALKEEIMKT